MEFTTTEQFIPGAVENIFTSCGETMGAANCF